MQEWKATDIKMNWLCSALIVSGLIPVVFAMTDSSYALDGWTAPNTYSTLVAGTNPPYPSPSHLRHRLTPRRAPRGPGPDRRQLLGLHPSLAMIGATVGTAKPSTLRVYLQHYRPATETARLADPLTNNLLYLGLAFPLAFADLLADGHGALGVEEQLSGCVPGTTPLMRAAAFVRIKAAESELTADERAASEK